MEFIDNREYPTKIAVSIYYVLRDFCDMTDEEFNTFMESNKIWDLFKDKDLLYGFLGGDSEDMLYIFCESLPRDVFDKFMKRYKERHKLVR